MRCGNTGCEKNFRHTAARDRTERGSSNGNPCLQCKCLMDLESANQGVRCGLLRRTLPAVAVSWGILHSDLRTSTGFKVPVPFQGPQKPFYDDKYHSKQRGRTTWREDWTGDYESMCSEQASGVLDGKIKDAFLVTSFVRRLAGWESAFAPFNITYLFVEEVKWKP